MKISEEERERLRRAHHLEGKSIRQLARETGHSRDAIGKIVAERPCLPEPKKSPRSSPVFGPYQARVEELLKENERLPRKQRYTSHKIYECLQLEGYEGCESRIRQVVGEWNRERHRFDVFLPLEFDPGQDAQCDWGQAVAVIAGQRQIVQVFVMRLCYSHRPFVMAFPSQQQECFLYGHVKAFEHFGGVPARISYDNMTTAVKIIKGERAGGPRVHRRESSNFTAFRSHYLFTSHFCPPRKANEKGQVEHGVGFSRRNFMVPIPEVRSFEDLNQYLLTQCLRDDQRQVHRETQTIGQAWEQERPYLRPLPAFEYECCERTTVRVTPYSQATFDTNRYSLPVRIGRREVTVKAFAFHIDILDRSTLLARHPRCYGREQDIFDPLHYLPLLEQRPGAFDHAKPFRRWRETWPQSYPQMLAALKQAWPDGRGVQEFIRILALHQDYPAEQVQMAIEQALAYGCIHLDGVLHFLHDQQASLETPIEAQPEGKVILANHPHLQEIGTQPIDLSCYERLLKQSW